MSATLINRNQMKHLQHRVGLHFHRLKHQVWKSNPIGEDEPAEVVAARKIVEEWEDKVDDAQQQIVDEIKAMASWIEQQFLFVSPEAGLAALEIFEATTRDDLPSARDKITGLVREDQERAEEMKRRGKKPSWDKMI